MKQYRFREATPLIQFIRDNRSKIIGHTLKGLYTNFWPHKNRYSMSDLPVVLEMDNSFLVIYYLVPSSIDIAVYNKNEIIDDKEAAQMLNIKDNLIEYYAEELELGEEKQLIENCVVDDIKVERFSHEYECDIQGNTRPEGGDYFLTIRLFLDSGKILCFCGADSICDGYIKIWCEQQNEQL